LRLPRVIAYRPCYRNITAAGGLISYRVESADIYRRAATYVDRILKGETPGVAINAKTARQLGPAIPDELPLLADEVIVSVLSFGSEAPGALVAPTCRLRST
jgi:hypothetical protein